MSILGQQIEILQQVSPPVVMKQNSNYNEKAPPGRKTFNALEAQVCDINRDVLVWKSSIIVLEGKVAELAKSIEDLLNAGGSKSEHCPSSRPNELENDAKRLKQELAEECQRNDSLE